MSLFRVKLRKILLYGMSRGAGDGLLALRGLVLASVLGPEVFGAWALFRLATNYGGFASLGVARGLEFFVARAAKSDTDSSGIAYWRSALGHALLVFGLLGTGALVASFFVADETLVLGMRWFAAAIVVEQVRLYAMLYLRASGSLRGYAIHEFSNAMLQLVLAVLLTPLWGLPGALGGFVLAALLSLAALMKHVDFRPTISCHMLREMMGVGLPLMLSLLFVFALGSADRLVVAAYGGALLLGLYAFGVSISGLAASFAWVVRVVVFPDVYSGAADKRDATLQDHLNGTVLPFARVFPLLLGVLALAMQPVVRTFLPQYEEAVPAARLFLFTGVTYGFVSLGSLGAVTAQRQKLIPLCSALALLVNVGLSFTALRLGAGLEGVAAGALVSNAAFGLAVLALVARAARITSPRKYLLKVGLPLGWCVSCTLVVAHLWTVSSVAGVVFSAVIYLLMASPIAYLAWLEFSRDRGATVSQSVS